MPACNARTRVAFLAAVVGSACNGQFDFDTALADAAVPPFVIDGGPDDASSTTDAIADRPRTGIHIACGASDCVTPGCCNSSTTGLSCVDIAEAGTCGGLLIQCDDGDDCPAGQVCCAEGDDLALPACLDGDICDHQVIERVHCEPEARCRTSNFVILCNPDRPSPCAQCTASSLPGLPPGYHQCTITP